MCGDYNVTVDYKMDTTSKSRRPLPSIQHMLHAEEMYDAWRCQHSNERDYTFHSSRHNSYSRIDLILVDIALLQKISSSAVHDITWSDHAPVSIMVEEGHPSVPAYI